MFIRGLAIGMLALCVALAGALVNDLAAYAQGGDSDYVDVGLTLVVRNHVGTTLTHDLDIIVVNHGIRPAYDVEVVVNIEYPEDSSHFRSAPKVPTGSASVESNKRTLRWLIPTLGGLQREAVTVRVTNRNTTPPDDFDYRNYPHEHFGKVTTSSFESNLHKGNNTDRVWSYRQATGSNHYNKVVGNYSVAVSVNDPYPLPGDTVNVTIEASRVSLGALGSPPPIDLKVALELTDGWAVDESGTITYDSSGIIKPDSVSYSNGVFNVGTLKVGDPRTNSVTLPITVASDAVVNQQCLTATLTGNPPPGTGRYDDDIADNVAKL